MGTQSLSGDIAQLKEPWVYVAKGMAIILVVIFHADYVIHGGAGQLDAYMRWVHMPVFFVIAGYLYHPKDGYLKNRAIRLLIPCIITILVIHFAFGDLGLISGEGEYVVLWFLPCLFIVQMLFSYIRFIYFPLQTIIILICFILAHNIPHVLPPWGIDASLAALYYYAIGFYGKMYIKDNKMTFGCLLLLMPFVIAQYLGFANNTLDMKHLLFPNMYFDAFVPVIASIVLIGSARLISNFKLLQYVGRSSMMIFLWHFTILAHFQLPMPKIIVYYVMIFLAIAIPIIIISSWGVVSKPLFSRLGLHT